MGFQEGFLKKVVAIEPIASGAGYSWRIVGVRDLYRPSAIKFIFQDNSEPEVFFIEKESDIEEMKGYFASLFRSGHPFTLESAFNHPNWILHNATPPYGCDLARSVYTCLSGILHFIEGFKKLHELADEQVPESQKEMERLNETLFPALGAQFANALKDYWNGINKLLKETENES